MLFKGELKLEAAAGASVAAELGLEVNYSGDKAAVKGARKPNRQKTGGGQRKIHVDQPQALQQLLVPSLARLETD